MKTNDKNSNSQESKETSNPAKSINIKIIGIVVAAIIVILVLFFMLFTRSAKSTVKEYVKIYEKGNAAKIIEIVDDIAVKAYRNTQNDLSKFDDLYKQMTDEQNKASEEEKKAYETEKEERKTQHQAMLDLMKEANIKYTIKNIKTEKVEGSSKLTKVICDITVTQDGKDTELKGAEFYTVKKGLKNYIVVSPI